MHPDGLSIIGLMAVTLMTIVLSGESGRRKGAVDLPPGGTPAGGYENPLYRLHRSHLNSVEVLALFGIPVMAAMAVGLSPGFLAVLVWVFAALRAAFVWLYLTGSGIARGGTRTFVFIASSGVNLLLVLAVIWKAL